MSQTVISRPLLTSRLVHCEACELPCLHLLATLRHYNVLSSTITPLHLFASLRPATLLQHHHITLSLHQPPSLQCAPASSHLHLFASLRHATVLVSSIMTSLHLLASLRHATVLAHSPVHASSPFMPIHLIASLRLIPSSLSHPRSPSFLVLQHCPVTSSPGGLRHTAKSLF